MGEVNKSWGAQLADVDWKSLRVADGSAVGVPNAIAALAGAASPAEAERAYWGLENSVVVQGQLYSAAEHVVPVLLSILRDADAPHVKLATLELLFQILNGVPDESEGDPELGERCRAAALDEVEVLEQAASDQRSGIREGVGEVLELLRSTRR